MVCECCIIGRRNKNKGFYKKQKSRCSLISCRVAVGIAKNEKNKYNICTQQTLTLIRFHFVFVNFLHSATNTE